MRPLAVLLHLAVAEAQAAGLGDGVLVATLAAVVVPVPAAAAATVAVVVLRRVAAIAVARERAAALPWRSRLEVRDAFAFFDAPATQRVDGFGRPHLARYEEAHLDAARCVSAVIAERGSIAWYPLTLVCAMRCACGEHPSRLRSAAVSGTCPDGSGLATYLAM